MTTQRHLKQKEEATNSKQWQRSVKKRPYAYSGVKLIDLGVNQNQSLRIKAATSVSVDWTLVKPIKKICSPTSCDNAFSSHSSLSDREDELNCFKLRWCLGVRSNLFWCVTLRFRLLFSVGATGYRLVFLVVYPQLTYARSTHRPRLAAWVGAATPERSTGHPCSSPAAPEKRPGRPAAAPPCAEQPTPPSATTGQFLSPPPFSIVPISETFLHPLLLQFFCCRSATAVAANFSYGSIGGSFAICSLTCRSLAYWDEKGRRMWIAADLQCKHVESF
jgi:hypothetical protein